MPRLDNHSHSTLTGSGRRTIVRQDLKIIYVTSTNMAVGYEEGSSFSRTPRPGRVPAHIQTQTCNRCTGLRGVSSPAVDEIRDSALLL